MKYLIFGLLIIGFSAQAESYKSPKVKWRARSTKSKVKKDGWEEIPRYKVQERGAAERELASGDRVKAGFSSQVRRWKYQPKKVEFDR